MDNSRYQKKTSAALTKGWMATPRFALPTWAMMTSAWNCVRVRSTAFERLTTSASFSAHLRLVPADAKVLLRQDSGFDGAICCSLQAEKARTMGELWFHHQMEPAQAEKMPYADLDSAFVEVRPGKRVGLLSLNGEQAWRNQKRHFRLVVQVTERTIDKKGSVCWCRRSSCKAAGPASMFRPRCH